VAIRDEIRKGAAQCLEPGERVQTAFLAKQPISQDTHHSVLTTGRRILSLAPGFVAPAGGVLSEVPRDIKVGPCRGIARPIGAFSTDLAVSLMAGCSGHELR
jgi:hypothetical protein